MKQNIPTEEELRLKESRKAQSGSGIKWRNIPRNWLHQAITYMDAGELSFRVFVQFVEMVVLWLVISKLFSELSSVFLWLIVGLIVHTWNWVVNGLFWAVIIFTFPELKNPGAKKTVSYLNSMSERLYKSKCISGIAIYGSVTRQSWHERSDIDIRFLRREGLMNLVCAAFITMMERFRAFIARQPMDLFLADDVDFLMKMRSDEIPVLLLERDDRMKKLYPDCKEQKISLKDLLGDDSDSEG